MTGVLKCPLLTSPGPHFFENSEPEGDPEEVCREAWCWGWGALLTRGDHPATPDSRSHSSNTTKSQRPPLTHLPAGPSPARLSPAPSPRSPPGTQPQHPRPCRRPVSPWDSVFLL